ncbi:protein tyrosine kinase src [Planoprotostelium fungivorum]|uniref:Protein tyrosine kinase src n=1 Tax=Planoprotostelium fungivorum TaxID=1890364 RepID=A0A2P6N2S4_9EUKA|nr:protein tyrosine kinase src [Planoprotostelium fungivorum]
MCEPVLSAISFYLTRLPSAISNRICLLPQLSILPLSAPATHRLYGSMEQRLATNQEILGSIPSRGFFEIDQPMKAIFRCYELESLYAGSSHPGISLHVLSRSKADQHDGYHLTNLSIKKLIAIIGCTVIGSIILFAIVAIIIYRRVYRHEKDDRDVSLFVVLDTDGVEFVEKIAEASRGEVWRGTYKETTTVAVKKCSPSVDVMRECNAIKGLHHPSIVQYLGRDITETYIVMEWMNAGTLQKYLSIHHQLSIETMFSIARDISSALSYLTSIGLVHTAIVPKKVSQILLSGQNTMTAKLQCLSCTVTESTVYKRQKNQFHTAPEIVDKERYSVSGHVYSLGVLLWTMATDSHHLYNDTDDERNVTFVCDKTVDGRVTEMITECTREEEKRPRLSELSERMKTKESVTPSNSFGLKEGESFVSVTVIRQDDVAVNSLFLCEVPKPLSGSTATPCTTNPIQHLLYSTSPVPNVGNIVEVALEWSTHHLRSYRGALPADALSRLNMAADQEFSFLDKIRVTVVEAQDLAPKDRNGKADPYFIVTLRKKDHKTKVLESTLNPIWKKEDATFMFEVSEDDLSDPDSQLKFTCWNKNRASRDDYMGETSILLQQLLDAAETIQSSQKSIDQWMRLESPEGKKVLVTGSVHICLEIMFATLDDEAEGANNSKIRARFFRHFPTVSVSEKLLHIHRCAYSSKKLPRKGTLTILDNHLCFYSNRLGQKKKLCIPFTEISNIEKKFPVAVDVTRKTGKKHTFDSFVARGNAFNDIISQWTKSTGQSNNAAAVAEVSASTSVSHLAEVKSTDSSPRRPGHGHRRMGSLVKPEAAPAGPGLVPVPNLVLVGATSFAHPPSPRGAHRRNKSHATGHIDFNPDSLAPSLSGAKSPLSPGSKNNSPIPSRLSSSRSDMATMPSFDIQNISVPPLPISTTVTIVVEIQNHRELKVDTPTVNVSLALGKPVQSLLNTLSNTYNIKPDVLARHVLKSYAYDSTHSNSSKHKVEMDPLYAISFYGLRDGDHVYLKKRKKGGIIQRSLRSKRLSLHLVLHIEIENATELRCPKETTVVLESECTADELFEKIASEGNIPITETDRPNYTILIVKPDGRSIRADLGNQLLSYLCADDRDIIRIIKKMPYKSVYEKFRIVEGRSQREIAYELMLHCIMCQMCRYGDRKQILNEEQQQKMIAHISSALNVESVMQSRLKERVKHTTQYGKDPLLLELSHKMQLIDHHPNYPVESFENPEAYEMWKQSEIQKVKEEAKTIVFDPEGFYGVICVRVIEAKDIHLPGKKSGQLDTYCTVRLGSQPDAHDKNAKKTKVIHKQSEPVWDEEFMMEVLYPQESLYVNIYDGEEPITEIRIDLVQLAEQPFLEDWFTLDDGVTKLHLFMEYNYSYSQYFRFLATRDGVPSHINQPRMDAILDYNSIFHIILKGLAESDGTNTSKSRWSNADERGVLLTSNSEWLLNEYRHRFGIRLAYWQVLVVKYINIYFNHKISMLQLLHSTLTSLSKKKHADLTPKEWEEYYEAATELCEKLSEVFTLYRKSFPQNQPEGGLNTALSCYFLLLSLGSENKQNSRKMAVSQIEDCLTNAVDTAFSSMKKEYKESNPSSQIPSMSHPSAHYMLSFMLKRMLKEAEGEMKYDEDFQFQGVDFATIVSSRYRQLLMDQVRQFCDEAAYDNSDVFELYFRIREFDTNRFYAHSAGEEKEKFNLCESFLPFLYGWIKETKTIIESTANESVDKDQCLILEQPDSRSNSSSLFDVFNTLTNAIEFMKSLHLDQPFVIIQFVEVVCHGTEIYIERVSEKCTEIFRKLGKNEYTPPVTTFILMNNIESARERLNQLLTDLESELNDSCKRSKQSAPGTADILIETFQHYSSTAYQASRNSLENLIVLASDRNQSNTTNTIKQLKVFVEQQLHQMSDNLQSRVFMRTLKKLWNLIITELYSIAAGRKTGISQSQIRQSLPILEDLCVLFQMKGKGLPKSEIDESSAPVRRLIEMWTQPSSALISMWWKLKEPMSAENWSDSKSNSHGSLNSNRERERPTITEGDVMGILERRNDSVEAKVFVEEQWSILHDVSRYQHIQAVRDHFELPLWEIIIKSYGNCTLLTNDVKNSGQLFLTSNYVCFDLRIEGPLTSANVMLPLKDIKTLQKTKHAFFWDAILIETKNGRSCSLFDFKNRDQSWKDICDQMIAVGNSSFVTEKKE